MSLRIPLYIAAIEVSMCLVVLVLRFAYVYIPGLWQDPHAINFLAAWIPAFLSILVAFVPDRELEMKRRILWRACVIFCGVLYSVVLWHQQVLTDAANSATNQGLLNGAVTLANQHSDTKFADVQKQVTGLGQSLDTTSKNLSSELKESTSSINAGLGKVGKPDPPEPAKIQFSLWRNGMQDTEFPIKEVNADQQSDGSFQVQFMVKNMSHVQAENIEIWVLICDLCSYSKEPTGFDNPAGNSTNVRHRLLAGLNPETSIADNILTLKLTKADLAFPVQVALAFKSTCKNCGGVESSSTYWVHLNPAIMPQQ